MTRRSNLASDDRGAIMVIALCFAVFAVAILYLAIGAAEAVLFREHLQDAADSAALSGAITSARIMNLLVLVNMVMVALLAVLVALKLIESICYIGMAIAAGLAWCTFGATLAAIPPLSALQQTIAAIYEEVKPMVFFALEILHDSSSVIADPAAPYIAEGVAKGDIVGKDDGLDAQGFGSTTAAHLPVKDDTFEGLCGKAGGFAIQIAWKPLNPIPGIGEIDDLLIGPMSTLSASLSEWFCGDGENSTPDLSQDLDLGFPKTPQAAACESSSPKNYTEGQEKDATSAECDAANAERVAAAPDDQGLCQTQCEPGGPYDRVTVQAREECDPAAHPGAKAFQYLEQKGTVDYKWDGTKWVRGEPMLRYQFANVKKEDKGIDALPCAAAVPTIAFELGFSTACGVLTYAGYYPGYNKSVHPADDPARVLAACTNECAPREPPPDTEKNPTRTVEFQQVTHVFGCMRHEKKEVPVTLSKQSPNSEAKGSGKGENKAPKKVDGKKKAGDERFQFRAVVTADQQSGESARLVRLSLWDRAAPSNPIERLRDFGNVSYAQAEYYYDGATDEAWMWTMKWRGRLKAFVPPTKDDAKGALRDDCDRYGNIDCAKTLGLVDAWKDLLLH